jgi:hypothetical protein
MRRFNRRERFGFDFDGERFHIGSRFTYGQVETQQNESLQDNGGGDCGGESDGHIVHSDDSDEQAGGRLGQRRSDILWGGRFAGGALFIRLTTGVISGLELVALLTDVVAAAIHPLRGLVARFPGAVTNKITAFFGPFPEGLPHFGAGLGSIEDTNDRANT